MPTESSRSGGFLSSSLITFTGITGGIVSIGTIAATIGVAHHRIGLNESAIQTTVPQLWAEQHIQHPHDGTVSDDDLATAQKHIDFKIDQVNKDIERVQTIVDDVDGKVDLILIELRDSD